MSIWRIVFSPKTLLSLRLMTISTKFLFMFLFWVFLFSDHNAYILHMYIFPPSCRYFRVSVITAVNEIVENNCLIFVNLLINTYNYLILLTITEVGFPNRVKQALVATLPRAPTWNTCCNPQRAMCRKMHSCGSTCGHPFFHRMQ